MTSTEAAAPPRKRAPRKSQAAKNAENAAEVKAAGVDARKAQQIREETEAATGEQVTAGAVKRLRGGVTGYKVIRPDGEPTPEQRRAAAAAQQHPDDPGPVEPVDEAAEVACPDCGGPCSLTHAGTPSPAPPPATDDAAEAPAPADPTVDELRADENLAAAVYATEAAEAEVDVRQLVARIDDAVPFDFATLIAGHVGTAADGSRVTVLDWPGVDNAPTPVDTAPGVQLPGEEAPPAAEVEDVPPARLSAELAAAIEEARDLEARAGELLEAAKAIKSQVQEAMGGESGLATVAVDHNGVKVAEWSRYTETRLDGTALKKANRAVWDAYAKTSQRRRFVWAD